MPLSSTNLIGEFQHYYNNFLKSSKLNKYVIPLPIDIPELHFLYKNSFIKLLFSEVWNPNDTSYRFFWMDNPSKVSWPTMVKTRLGIYPQSGKYFELTTDPSSGDNFFFLDNDDVILLDALLSFRLGNTITIYDDISTSFDSNTNVLIASFNYLQTNLSKMILIYLKLKVYDDYSDYDNDNIISDPNNTLELAYESYLTEQIFNYVSAEPGLVEYNKYDTDDSEIT